MSSRAIDETGNRYGSLVVTERGERFGWRQGAFWLCNCDCGNTATVHGGDLRSGNVVACYECIPRLPGRRRKLTRSKKVFHVRCTSEEYHQLEQVHLIGGHNTVSDTVRWLIAEKAASLGLDEVMI